MLCAQLCHEVVKARGISAWPSKTGDKTEFDRILGDVELNWNRCCRSLSRDCGMNGACDDHRHLTAHQLRRHLRQSIILTLGPQVCDRHIPPLLVAGFGQTLAEYRYPCRDRKSTRLNSSH